MRQLCQWVGSTVGIICIQLPGYHLLSVLLSTCINFCLCPRKIAILKNQINNNKQSGYIGFKHIYGYCWLLLKLLILLMLLKLPWKAGELALAPSLLVKAYMTLDVTLS